MARKTPTYQPVSITIWDDTNFLSCSEEAQLLYLYFLTSSECPIPGVLLGGEATVAERRNKTVERVRSLYSEMTSKGLDVRWEGRVLWTPKSFKHRPVGGPNAMKSMSTWWRNIPNVSFKHELWRCLKTACERWPKDFRELFEEPARVVIAATSPTDQVSLPLAGFDPQPRYPTPCLTPSVTPSPDTLGNPVTQGLGAKTPGAQYQYQDQDLERHGLDLSSSSEPSGGGDLDPARPAPKLQVVRDPEALAEYERLKAAGGWSFPPKGGAA